MKADKILCSNYIFTSTTDTTFSGFVAVADNKIIAVESGDYSSFVGPNTQVFELGDNLVTPGFVDTHCFFTGYLLTQTGINLSKCCTVMDVFETISKQSSDINSTIIARELKQNIVIPQDLLETFTIPIIIFVEGHETCYMNNKATEVYNFTPETCWSESYWKLLKFVLSNEKYVITQFKHYLTMLNQKGITSIKEMGFDDYYGFTDYLLNLDKSKELTARIHFMSQPVGYDFDLDYGLKMRETFKGDFVRFSGYNQMTDGSISQLEAEMKEPYLLENTYCKKDINWSQLENDVLIADKNGLRFSLHAQGDGAISKAARIFDKCEKINGKLVNRHAMTDLECSNSEDLKLMGEIGVIGEIYPQIMSLASREDKVNMITRTIGEDRGKNYWNRRAMLDNGIVLSCATDLPLLIDDIPESIYHTVGGLFPEGGEPFNLSNTIKVHELLKAWTIGGQYNLGCELDLGTLEVGKKADIAVVNTNLLTTPIKDIRQAKIVMTIVDGNLVFNGLHS